MPRGAWLGIFFVTYLTSCSSAKTPQGACSGLLRGVREGDADLIFDYLLESTQWSFYTVQKNHRRMRDLVATSYPEHERAAALGRLYGAEDDSGRDLFGRLYTERYAESWAAAPGHSATDENKDQALDRNSARVNPSAERPGEYLCQIEGLKPFHLVRSASGRWGVADIAAEWDQAQLRAIHDLETVEKNAALYRRIGAKAPSLQ